MNNSIKSNKFYSTFEVFLTPNTRTAEKTMNENSRITQNNNTEGIRKSFSKYAFPCSLLLIPIIALSASRVHLNRMMKNLDKEYFLAVNNEFEGGFLKGLSQKITLSKYNFVNGIVKLLKPLREKKDKFFYNLQNTKKPSFIARTITNINTLFKSQRVLATERMHKNIKNDFNVLEKRIESLLQLIEQSKDGKVKVLINKAIATKPYSEIPKQIDLSKTINGQDRVEEIRKLLNKIKQYLNTNDNDFCKFIKEITYSCEDIFNDTSNILIELRKYIHNCPEELPMGKKLIKNIFDNLTKYRYAENITTSEKLSVTEVRKFHLKNAAENLKELKALFKNNHIANEYIQKIENILTNDTKPENMGLFEQIRALLKCNDIKSTLVKNDIDAALLKQCQPDNYIEVKKCINDFIKSLKKAQINQKYMLPTYLEEIDRGKIITNTLAVALPTGVLTANYLISDKNKNAQKRNIISFLAGASAMMASHYFLVCTRFKSIISGIITSIITTKLLDKLSEK